MATAKDPEKKKRTRKSSATKVESAAKDYVLSKFEQETVISTTRADEYWDVYSCDKSFIAKMDKMLKACPEAFELIKQDAWSKTYRVYNKKLVSIRAPRVMSEKTKQLLAKNRFGNANQTELDDSDSDE